jgi:3-dehydroquinate synthase
MIERFVVPVHAERTYEVIIGRGLLGDLAERLDGSQRVAVIHPGALRASADAIQSDLIDSGFEVILLEIPEAEDAKTSDVAAFCWNALGASGFTRSDSIVGMGGGATTDLAGFVAATWLRGVRLIHIPTTVLGMVDAAVGGKTGINTEAGKNLVGAFYSPWAVLCDVTALETLPENDLRAGLAEVVKVGLTNDASILVDIIERTEECLNTQGDLLPDLIRRAVQVKAAVVSEDFLETGGKDGRIGREVLNYGHTFGHAVERLENYRWRHGAAVSVGLMYVAELARLGGRLDEDGYQMHVKALGALGLPVTYPAGRWDQLYSAMQVDKKARGSLLRFVVLDGLGSPAMWEGPDPTLLVAAYADISA